MRLTTYRGQDDAKYQDNSAGDRRLDLHPTFGPRAPGQSTPRQAGVASSSLRRDPGVHDEGQRRAHEGNTDHHRAEHATIVPVPALAYKSRSTAALLNELVWQRLAGLPGRAAVESDPF